MSPDERLARINKLIEELLHLASVSEGLKLRNEAGVALYNAALLSNDQQGAADQRENLHILLDSLLDNGARLHKLRMELRSLNTQ